MDATSLKKFLLTTEEQGIANLYNKGYQWFKSHYLPRLRLADELLPDEVELIADSWYLVGDVYDFNEMPLLAIEAYRKVLEYDEETDGAYRELAHMHERIGEYQKALEYLNIALDYAPDDEELMEAKAEIQDSINYTTEPYLTADNRAWKWGEWIGQERPQLVIEAAQELGEEANTEELQRLAQAYGVLEQHQDYLATWERIVALEEPIDIYYADWFYLPQEVAQQAAFWKLLQGAMDNLQELETTLEVEEEERSLEELLEEIEQFYRKG